MTTTGTPVARAEFGKLALTPRQPGRRAGRRFAAHVGSFAKTEHDDFSVGGQCACRRDPAPVIAVHVHARGENNLALGQGGPQAREGGYAILRASSQRPRSQHFGRRVREWTNDGDAARIGGQRQNVAIGEKGDRPSGRVGGERRRRLRREFGRGDAPIGIVEQSKLLFQSQDAAHGRVYVLQFDEPARESFWQAADIDAAHHVDVDARPQRERRRFDEIRRDAMLSQFGDGVVVADDNPIETKFASEIVAQ